MSLLRSSLLVGAGAVASRLLGFARDILIAGTLGAGPVADAFLAAYQLPNLVRRTLSEGGLNAALVPALARLDGEAARRFAGEALAALALALLALVAAVELSAGLTVLLLAPGLGSDPGTLALAGLYSRLVFPLVAGVTLASFMGAVLNYRRRFAAAAVAPLVMNATLVAALLALPRTGLPLAEQAAWLAAASSLAGVLQLAVVAAALCGPDAPIRLTRPRLSPALRKLLATAGLTLVAGSAVPLMVLAGTQAASYLPSGVSWLYYADRLVQLPLGAMGAVMGAVLLPEFASLHAADERASLMAAQNRAIEAGLLLACPAAVALVVLAEPIARVLFERGAFGPQDSAGTAAAIAGMSIGLPFAAIGKVLAQSLFARGALRGTLAALAAGLAGTALAAALMAPRLGALGIGLAVAAGFVVHALVLAAALHRERLVGLDRRLGGRIARTGFATAALGGALLAALALVDEPLGAWGLAGLCVGGLGFYAAAALATGALGRGDLALLTKKA